MKKEIISDALDNIDARYLEEALHVPARMNALVATVGFGLFGSSKEGISPYPIKYVEGNVTEGSTEAGYRVPHWEDMHVTTRFAEFEHPLGRFSTGAKAIDVQKLGASMGRVDLQGYDIYTDTTYTAEGEVFAIDGISTEFALALRFDGDEKYYVYRNVWFTPDTLGDLIDALSLGEHLTSQTVYYDYVNERGEHAKVEFEGLSIDTVWQMLLSDRSVQNVYYQNLSYFAKMSISVSVPIVGIENVGIWVTEDGYLVTNIGGTGKAFDIGVERVNAFVNYVTENCQGYEIIYTYPSGYPVPEAGADHNGFEVTVQTTPPYNPQ